MCQQHKDLELFYYQHYPFQSTSPNSSRTGLEGTLKLPTSPSGELWCLGELVSSSGQLRQNQPRHEFQQKQPFYQLWKGSFILSSHFTCSKKISASDNVGSDTFLYPASRSMYKERPTEKEVKSESPQKLKMQRLKHPENTLVSSIWLNDFLID